MQATMTAQLTKELEISLHDSSGTQVEPLSNPIVASGADYQSMSDDARNQARSLAQKHDASFALIWDAYGCVLGSEHADSQVEQEYQDYMAYWRMPYSTRVKQNAPDMSESCAAYHNARNRWV
jgi:hypothetical protein